MIYKLKILPFDEFYLSCVFNPLLSIAASQHKSYKKAGYLNFFSYGKEQVFSDPETESHRYLRIFVKDDFINLIKAQIYSWEKIVISQNENEFIKVLKYLITKEFMVFVNVNLYYWLPNSFGWKKNNWYHLSLITGFDEKEKIFYVFDDDYHGYGLRKVPEERLCKAIANPSKELFCRYHQLSNDIKPFEVSIQSVLQNAERIIQELLNINTNNLWILEPGYEGFNHYINQCSFGVHTIVNRQIANKFLINLLYDLKFLSQSEYFLLIKNTDDLKKGWNVVKNIFIKYGISHKKELNIEKLYRLAEELFSKEYSMWIKLLNGNSGR